MTNEMNEVPLVRHVFLMTLCDREILKSVLNGQERVPPISLSSSLFSCHTPPHRLANLSSDWTFTNYTHKFSLFVFFQLRL